MRPLEHFNQAVLWLLREIKKEQLATPEGEPVEFGIRPEKDIKPTRIFVTWMPSPDIQRKLLRKLQDWGALDLEEIRDFMNPDRFLLTIHKKRFREIYQSYEAGPPYFPEAFEVTKPKRTIISQKTLKLIAGHIADLMSHRELTEFFSELGIPKEFDIEDTKRNRVLSVLENLARSDEATLFKLIEEDVHPLSYGGNVAAAIEAQRKYNSWLIYDGLELENFKIKKKTSRERVGEQAPIDSKPQLNLVKELADYYLRLMQVIDLYFQSKQKRDEKLNEIYLQLCNKIEKLVKVSNVQPLKENYEKPFRTLFSAQKEMDEKTITLSDVKNNMSAFYGEIQRVLIENQGRKTEETDLAEVDQYLKKVSELQKASRDKESYKEKLEEAIPIKIVGETEIKIKGAELQKKKDRNVVPLELPPNTKWEDITIKFLDGHNADIKVKDLKIKADYKQMGFEDSKKRLPNKQWELLQLIAYSKGELSWEKPGTSDLVKKKKQLLSKALKNYFQIDEDPFLSYKQEKAYKVRINLISD